MAARTRRAERREEPLSRERIVGAAIELLDAAGEDGLTFRALAERLATGPGAIYWHVTGKEELLGAATDAVVTAATEAADAKEAGTGSAGAAAPRKAIRALALAVFDAVEAHPWLGTQLSRSPSRSPMLRVFERIGRQVQALGVPEAARFTAASALLYYILGVGGQNAAESRAHRARRPETGRTEFLGAASAAWAGLDPDEFAFTRSVADRLRDHDDRAEFLAGIDYIITGATAARPEPAGPAAT